MDEQALVCVITDCRIQGIQLQIRPKNPACASGISVFVLVLCVIDLCDELVEICFVDQQHIGVE